MKKNFAISIAAVAALFAGANAQAVEISWDHLEASYIASDFEVDGVNKYEPDGFSLKGLHELNSNVFTTFGYQSIAGEIEGAQEKTDKDINTFHVGLGFKSVINPTMQWYISGGVLRSEIDNEVAGSTTSIDEKGYFIESGLRKQFTQSVQGDLFFRNSKYSSDSETTIEANIFHRVGSTFSLGFGVSKSENINTYQVLLKYKY